LVENVGQGGIQNKIIQEILGKWKLVGTVRKD
jgi:hypothetical protein